MRVGRQRPDVVWQAAADVDIRERKNGMTEAENAYVHLASTLEPGETINADTEPGYDQMGVRNVSVDDIARVAVLRGLLIAAAAHRSTMTYGVLKRLTNSPRLAKSLNRDLRMLCVECERRGEPSLAALVVQAATEEVGHGFVGDPVAARRACYDFWNGQLHDS